MKNILTTSLLLMSICISQGMSQVQPTVPLVKGGTSLAQYDLNFITTTVGAVDTVWQKIYPNPGNKDVTSEALFRASDGSFYLSSLRTGGYLTKFTNDGTIEWTIDRDYDSDDTTNPKILSKFLQISERANKDIVLYGLEGLKYQNSIFFGMKMPERTTISPNGIVVEKKSSRGILESYSFDFVYSVFSDKVFYVHPVEKFFTVKSVDADMTKVIDSITVNSELTTGDRSAFRGIFPYSDNTFIACYSGYTPKYVYSMAVLQYSRDFTLLKKNIIPSGTFSSVLPDEQGNFLVSAKDDNYELVLKKFDKDGKVLWERKPKIVQDLRFRDCTLEKSATGGYILRSELYTKTSEGKADYNNEERYALIGKVSEEGEVLWYYTTGRARYWNIIRNFAETPEGDIVFVCNSINTFGSFDAETPMQITRLRPRASSVGEESVISQDITISPNPASTTFTISGIDNISEIKVMNSLGMEVAIRSESVNTNSSQIIDISTLASGVYFAQCRTAKGVVTKPFVVAR